MDWLKYLSSNPTIALSVVCGFLFIRDIGVFTPNVQNTKEHAEIVLKCEETYAKKTDLLNIQKNIDIIQEDVKKILLVVGRVKND